ncbi:MAG TPA: cytochrome P450 [Acidimicrobiales bacterium]|jgi:cytochrome P450 family 142 subfamily A polypeptide 1|nr:cytochrome P450 [Acidimicrobiales bacterium]
MAVRQQLDLLDPNLYADDPWTVYKELRDNHPVYRDSNGIWCVSRYRDVLEVEKDTATYSSAHGSRPLLEFPVSIINKDDPLHTQQRKLVSGRFTPGHLRRHEDLVRAAVTGLIDGIAAQGHAEVVEDLAAPLPAMIICDLIGYDHELWPNVKWWSETTMGNAGYKEDDPRRPYDAETSMADFAEQSFKLYQARQAEPRDDLMSIWAHATLDDQPMSVEEVLNDTILLVDGGAETTRSTIGQTVLALSDHPDQKAALQAHPELMRTAVEEFIRWSSPILNMRRTVTTEHERHGQILAEGDQVLLMYPSANRDERVFENPDTFDVGRKHNHHVAFGFGTHFCLGANLARLEIRVLFEELLRRLPDFRVAPGYEPQYAPGFFTRTLKELPIEFTPAG